MSPKIIAPDLVVSENKKNVFVEYKVNMQQWESMYTSSHGLDSLYKTTCVRRTNGRTVYSIVYSEYV